MFFRSPIWPKSNNAIDWKDLNDPGMHLGSDWGSNVKIYKKFMDEGLHIIDDTSALYLFVPEGPKIGIVIGYSQYNSMLGVL